MMRNGKSVLVGIGALALSVLGPLAWGAERFAERPALGGLLWSAGQRELPSVAPVGPTRVVALSAPKHREIGGVNLLCSMDMKYKETVYGFLLIRAWKELTGTAVLNCLGRDPIRLEIEGEGFAPGLQLPNQSPVHSVNEGVAANLEVRVPSALVPKQLEGEYYYGGADIVGIGGAVSPFVNSDASINITISLPSNFHLSAGISISRLSVRLAR